MLVLRWPALEVLHNSSHCENHIWNAPKRPPTLSKRFLPFLEIFACMQFSLVWTSCSKHFSAIKLGLLETKPPQMCIFWAPSSQLVCLHFGSFACIYKRAKCSTYVPSKILLQISSPLCFQAPSSNFSGLQSPKRGRECVCSRHFEWGWPSWKSALPSKLARLLSSWLYKTWTEHGLNMPCGWGAFMRQLGKGRGLDESL